MQSILSHYRAGSGVVLIDSADPVRLQRELCAVLPETATIAHVAAPSGPVRDARTGQSIGSNGLAAALQWGQQAPGRVLVVYDLHPLLNNPGTWRALEDALPGLRCPKGAVPEDPASILIGIAPQWDLSPANPLRGRVPILRHDLPDRQGLLAVASRLHRLNGEQEQVIDALCGLSADTAEQVCAEVLARRKGWDVDALRDARRQQLREAGLEIWAPVSDLGGLSGLKSFVQSELIPWVRDPQLAVRRVLCAGLPGTGKSYWGRWLAGVLKCECARLSISKLKAGLVGATEAALRRALGTIDALGAHSPVICVLDEIDCAMKRESGDPTDSGIMAELLTWLQESRSQAIVIGTLNKLEKLDAAIESRFDARFRFELSSQAERQSVAEIHLAAYGCPTDQASAIAACTDTFSNREIEQTVKSIARLTARKPDGVTVSKVCASVTPASRTQADQLKLMRQAAATLRLANDPEDIHMPGGRQITR